ncbi:MAG: hypothetical protein GXP36_14890 [Actinobacteria bacterium]|nr:hypothetical protein [Actinomycetota bacterium]
MWNRLTMIALTFVLVSGVLGGPPRTAEAAEIYDLGGDDTLVWLTPWETKMLYATLDNPGGVRCSVPVLPSLVSDVAEKLNRICSGVKGLNDISFYNVKSHLYFASLNGGCGAFVIDDAPWRWWTKYRPAKTEAAGINTTHVYTPPGRETVVEGISVVCTEWVNPAIESNLLQGEIPPPTPPTTTLGPSLTG